MNPLWVNVQASDPALLPGKPQWSQYSGMVLIADWPDKVAKALADLPVPVRLWRFTQDPRQWAGWPDQYIARCPWGQFANEPDLEGIPSWYSSVVQQWQMANGRTLRPPYHDERAGIPDYLAYDAMGCHCYAGDWSNYIYLASRQSRPIWVTEYDRQGAQSQCLVDIAASGIPDTSPVALFAWHWDADHSYDLANVTLVAPKGQTDVQVWIQAGHLNTGDNCDGSLRGETGAQNEVGYNQEVAQAVVTILMDSGVTAKLVDANTNCVPVPSDVAAFVALHCQSNPPAESGWDIGTMDPSKDGNKDGSQKLVTDISSWYEAAVGMERRGWCQNNPNVQQYYAFSNLPSACACALIEMGNADLDSDFIKGHIDRMAYGIANGVLGYLDKPTLTIPSGANPPLPDTKAADPKALLSQLQESLTQAQSLASQLAGLL